MEIYLVGGAVRDKLLGYPYHECDWVVVGATPQQLLSQGYQAVGKDFPVFLHPDTKEEYALARTERKSGPGYTGFDCFASPDVTLEQDLLRRDLSINAIAEDSDGNIVDPCGGQQDLNNKLLRHVSPAFIEDPLRVLRVARFCARYHHLGFQVAEETMLLMQQIAASGELSALVAERVWKELQRALGEKSPQQFFLVLQQAHALTALLPEFPLLSSALLDNLSLAADQQLTVVQRFSLLFVNSDKQKTEAICQRIKAPNAFRDLACLISCCATQCKEAINQAEQRLALLEQLDAFRRPERLTEFLACCELLYPNSPASEQLRQAVASCATINAGEIAKQGIKGKDIAIALRQQRLLAIENNKQ